MQLDKVTLFCFFASYVVAFLLEGTQLLRRVRINRWAAVGFAAAGLVAHTAYLAHRSGASNLPPLLASTHDWLLVLAWLIVVIYLAIGLWSRELALGLFLLPAVVVLVGAARFASDRPNGPLGSLRALGMLHASFWVFGIGCVFVGFLLSLMYLIQHRRLKHRRAERTGLHLFSLERLTRLNWWVVVVSVPLLTLGMVSGVWLSLMSRNTAHPVGMASVDILAAAVLWGAMMLLFGWLLTRRPTGRMVAWRTMWACGFLLVTQLVIQMLVGEGIHGTGPQSGDRPADHREGSGPSDALPTRPGVDSAWQRTPEVTGETLPSLRPTPAGPRRAKNQDITLAAGVPVGGRRL